MIVNKIFKRIIHMNNFKHIKCRNTNYCSTNIARYYVPDNQIDWSIEYHDYKPVYYDSQILEGKPWADPVIDAVNFRPNWNNTDGQVNRKSHNGNYKIINKYPINPFGRTGLKGRGLLGRWGPNHAADPIVTKWKRDQSGLILKNNVTNQKILQMCTIKRHDNGEWAIPGGMVDPGENVNVTLKREFLEEAMNSEMNSSDLVNYFFSNLGEKVYSGYIDDPRNTDNAWMESVAVNFHDSTNEYVGMLKLSAGDDAVKVQWLDIDKNIQLYANHKDLLEIVVNKLNAHW